ncbi:MAG: hemagglutinin, partial [Alphaproteobacteria bacterium]|nr:hemagglutinin [Alphaproteobacteria bacterium]
MTTFNKTNRNALKTLLASTAMAAGILTMAQPAQADEYAVWSVDHYQGGTSASITGQSQGYVQFTGNTSTVIAVLGQKNIGELGHVDINANLWVAKGQGADPMSILGKLTSNGRIVVMDNNGVFFGPNSRIDTAGIIATTGNIDNDQLLNNPFGQYVIDNVGGNGTIEMHGLINVADAGLAAFVAPSVINNGIINARLGKVAFGSGEKVTLDLYGDNLIEIAVDDKIADALIEHNGSINAEGGVVQMTAQAAKAAVDDVINMNGVVTVASATQVGGKIILSGGNSGKVSVSGTANASGKTGGGDIQITGENIEVSQDTYLLADAIESGNGGNVYVYGLLDTLFRGNVYARGGAAGGNGGFVEVSAANRLGYDGSVNTMAVNGLAGSFLLDPEFAIIHSGSLHNLLGLQYVLSAQSLANDLARNGSLTVQANQFIDVGSEFAGLGIGNGPIDLANYNY